MKKIYLILLSVFIIQFGYAQLSGNYSIGQGKDYDSISHAITDVMTKGVMNDVVFQIEPGTYHEQLIIGPIAGTGNTTTVTFESSTGKAADVVISWKPEYDSLNFTILLLDAKYLVFQNLTLTTDTMAGNVIELRGSCEYNQFVHNDFRAFQNGHGIFIYSPDNQNIPKRYNRIYQNNFYQNKIALSLNGSEFNHDGFFFIEDNYFLDQREAAIYALYQAGMLVQHNLFHNTLDSTGKTGIHLDKSPYQNKIRDNVFSFNQAGDLASAIKVEKSFSATGFESFVTNNMIFIQSDEFVTGITVMMSDYFNFYHNTIHLAGNSYSNMCVNLLYSNNLKFRNNLFTNVSGGRIYSAFGLAGFTSNYNGYEATGKPVFSYDGYDMDSLAAWQTKTRQDINSAMVEPVFCSDSNLHLLQNIDSLKCLKISSYAKDIDGDNRNFVNPGADEFKMFYPGPLGDVALCANEMLTLVLPNAQKFEKYAWSTGSNNDTLTTGPFPNGADTILIKAYGWYRGCRTADSLHIFIKAFPGIDLGEADTLCSDSVKIYSVPAGYTSYLWQDQSKEASFRADKQNPGMGTHIIWVQVADSNGCSNTDSTLLTIIKCESSIDDLARDDNFMIYPVPAANQLFIDSKDKVYRGKVGIEITGMDGKMELKTQSMLPAEIDLGSLARGSYILRIEKGSENRVFRIIKM